MKETQRDALRAFKTELRRKAQDERAAARRKAEALRSAQVKEAQVDAWAQAWSVLDRLPREVEALNLDRGEALLAALSDLRAAARS